MAITIIELLNDIIKAASPSENINMFCAMLSVLCENVKWQNCLKFPVLEEQFFAVTCFSHRLRDVLVTKIDVIRTYFSTIYFLVRLNSGTPCL